MHDLCVSVHSMPGTHVSHGCSSYSKSGNHPPAHTNYWVKQWDSNRLAKKECHQASHTRDKQLANTRENGFFCTEEEKTKTPTVLATNDHSEKLEMTKPIYNDVEWWYNICI